MMATCSLGIQNVHKGTQNLENLPIAWNDASYTCNGNAHRHSGPQGKVQPLTIIDDPSAWRAGDYPDPAKLAYVLTPDDVAELDEAVAAAINSGKEVQVRH